MIETTILANLVTNQDYIRKVLPFIKPQYFDTAEQQFVFETINHHFTKYNDLPSKQALLIEVQNSKLSEQQHSNAVQLISNIEPQQSNLTWLLEQTEKFCQHKAIYLAINKSIEIFDGTDKQLNTGAIPKLLSDALAVCFDSNIGHDFAEDFALRFEHYHTKEAKLAFDLELFNLITNGGVSRKTLNIILAGTGVGKSLFMCHCAANHFLSGANVLYITLEMSEQKIAERIDANLLDVPLDQLSTLTKDAYQKKIDRIKQKSIGKLIIKEYPTASANVSHFRYLLNELKLKRNFVPDIIYIDYINLCISARVKYSNSINSYAYIKAIAEELRGLAVEFNVPIFSATQVNRAGFTSADIGLENTADSFGLPATADFMFALSTNDQLASLNQMLVKQLKNRYRDENQNKKFVIGIDKSKMRLYDCDQNSQAEIINDDRPVIDKGAFFEEENRPPTKFKKFGEFK